MSIDIKKWLLALGLQWVLVGAAAAQVAPFTPVTEPSDFQYFVQPDLSNYGSGVHPNVGWFGSMDYLLWATTTPNRAQIGVQDGARLVYNGNFGFTTQTNSADSSFIRAALESGTRFEFGYMDECDRGWFFSGYRLNTATSILTATNSSMVFAEPLVPVYDNNPITPDGLGVVGALPILNGFVDNRGAINANGPIGGANLPDGYADDVNRNNIYGPHGVDVGLAPAAPQPIQPLDGVPSPNLNTAAAPYVPIDYGDAVPLPILFSELKATHRVSNYSVELNRQWRLATGRFGGNVDVFAGPRFVNFDDQFLVTTLGGILADSYWNARAQNRAVGGQVGFRVNQKHGRLMLSTEGRIFTGADLQTVRLDGQIGSLLTQTVQNPSYTVGTNTYPNPQNLNATVSATPPTQGPATITENFTNAQANNPGRGTMAVRLNQPLNLNRTTFATTRNFVSFSPMGELRFKAQYQIFDAVNVNAGWTGTWMDGLMRANNMIDYTLPSMGIVSNRNVQGVFINGFNMGFELNR